MESAMRIRINGQEMGLAVTAKDILNACWAPWVPHVRYMSDTAIVEAVHKAFELVNDAGMLRGAVKTACGRVNKKLTQLLNHIHVSNVHEHREQAKEMLHRYFLDLFMQTEGLGTLRGFGYTKYDAIEGRRRSCGGLGVNPERQSITHARR